MNSRLSAPPGEERDPFEIAPEEIAQDGIGPLERAPLERVPYPRAEASAESTSESAPASAAENLTGLTAGRMLAGARLLWQERVLLRWALAAGMLAGVLLALAIPSEYQSTVQLMPPDNPSNGGLQMLAALAGKTGGAMGSIAGDALGVKSAGSLFIGILRSRTVADRLVERFHLQKTYRAKLEESARKRLAENTAIAEDRKNGIITLTVSDHERQRARALATAYVEELNRLAAELSTSSAHRERVFLEGRLASVKRDLDQSTRELGEFSSQNATIDLKDEGRAMLEEAAALQGELIAAEAERQSLEAVYTAGNFRVRAVDARVSELRRQLRQLGGAQEGVTQKAAAKADGVEGDSAESDSLYPSLRRLPLLGEQYADLYRRTKIQEAVFETLTQQYEVAKVQEAKETPSVKMLDEASLPETRSFPPRAPIVMFCGAFGFLGAVAWIIALERWQHVDAADPKKQFSQEVFAGVHSALPWAAPNGSRWQAASHQVWVRLARRGKRGSDRQPRERAPNEHAAEDGGDGFSGDRSSGNRSSDDRFSGERFSDHRLSDDDRPGEA
jgi:uncharacterized protein involved in exopolysaccharide biosynthesis